jgi:uncharacterized protein
VVAPVTLSLSGVSYRYAGASDATLKGVDLELAPGRVLGVAGPNGAGKSTLCIVAVGLAPLTIGGTLEGSVTIDGFDTRTAAQYEVAQRVGILFQEPTTQLYASAPPVWEEIAFGPRNLSLPLDEVVERTWAAIKALGIEDIVDRDRIGLQAICGLSGMAITAASGDSRIKAVATSSMYDMARSMSCSYQDSYTPDQRREVVDYLSRQRWTDAENGSVARGPHEVPFDDDGNVVTSDRVLPESLPDGADPITSAFFDYYRTDRGFHPRAINSTTAWTATTPMPFFEFTLMNHLDHVAPRRAMLVAGDDAHSRYYSEDVHTQAPDTTDLLIVHDADHVALYDRTDLIPFDKLETFFRENLKPTH